MGLSAQCVWPAFRRPAHLLTHVHVQRAAIRGGRRDWRLHLDLVILDDPEGALPNYDAILLVSPQASRDARLLAVLRPLVGAIDVEAMRAANLSVDREDDKLSFGEAATRLARHVGLGGS